MGDILVTRHILSLCSGTGSWERPFAEDPAYTVTAIAIEQGVDVRDYHPEGPVFGILAAPPCTSFAGSGARWWAEKDKRHPELLAEGIAVVEACLRIIGEAEGLRWWALENPVGRIPRLIPALGKASYTYQPYEYGGWADDPTSQGYSKRTCIWQGGIARRPDERRVPTAKGSALWRIGPSGRDGVPRWKLRSVTPEGYARAFKAMIEAEWYAQSSLLPTQ